MSDRLRHSTDQPFVKRAGRCIYCRQPNAADKLTREHVIPKALGGGVVILDAVCDPHRDLINIEFETPVLDHWLGPFRHSQKLVSKRSRDTTRRIPVKVEQAGVLPSTINIKIQEYPPILLMPIPAKQPYLFSSEGPGPVEWSGVQLVMRDSEPPLPFKKNAAPKKNFAPRTLTFEHQIPLFLVQRFLAKIAHGVAVSHFGFGFTPFLLDLIEGRGLENAGDLIGCPLTKAPIASRARAHMLRTDLLPPHEGVRIIGIAIQLFASLGGPIYYVLAGAAPEDSFRDWGNL